MVQMVSKMWGRVRVHVGIKNEHGIRSMSASLWWAESVLREDEEEEALSKKKGLDRSPVTELAFPHATFPSWRTALHSKMALHYLGVSSALPSIVYDQEYRLQATRQKSYDTIPHLGRNFEEKVLLNQSFKPKSKSGRTCIKEEKPDGGWGWMVVFGVALSNMTTQSLISVFGLLFIEKLEMLGITTRGASLMMGVQITALNLSGLITGPVINAFSYRKTAVAGSLLVVSGLIFTTHADSLAEFVFTYSLFTGLGLGLLYPATFVAIDSYFSKRRSRAVGLSVAGTGIGQMLLPLLVEYLLDSYGFRGTLLILAGIASHSLLGATLYQPSKWHMKRYETQIEESMEEDNLQSAGEEKTSSNLSIDVNEIKAEKKKKRKKGMWAKLGRAMNGELLKSFSFLNLLIGLALVYTANMCFSMLLPFFLESINYSLDNVALCMSVLSGADIIGRLIVPVFTDNFRMKSKTVFFLGAALSGFARSALMFPKDFSLTLILAAACGVVRAALICNFNICISEQTTPEKLPAALGFHMIFKGVAMMVFAPLIGFIRDYTKSYTLCMHIISVFFLALPFSAWLLECIFTRKKH